MAEVVATWALAFASFGLPMLLMLLFSRFLRKHGVSCVVSITVFNGVLVDLQVWYVRSNPLGCWSIFHHFVVVGYCLSTVQKLLKPLHVFA